MRLSHFLRRTGIHPGASPGQAFGGKCFSAQMARRRSAVLVSVLVHAAALLALFAVKPNLSTPPGLQSIEVMLVPADPDMPDRSIDPLSSEAPIKPWWRPDKLHAIAALESIGATQRGIQVTWTAALGEMPKVTKVYAKLETSFDFRRDVMEGVLDCLAPEPGNVEAPAGRASIRRSCAAAVSFAAASLPRFIDLWENRSQTISVSESMAMRNRGLAAPPWSSHQVPMEDWDVLLRLMLR